MGIGSNRQCTSACRRTHSGWALLACLGVLCGCATVQPTGSTGSLGGLEARAQDEASRGNWASAARLYDQLAKPASGAARSAYLIQAASLWVKSSNFVEARRDVDEAAAEATPDQRQQVIALTAEVQLGEGNPSAALTTLSSLHQPVPLPIVRDAAATRGQALFRLHRWQEAVSALVEREIWLDSTEQVIANQKMIWDGLKSAGPNAQLGRTGDPIVDGWLALAPIASSYSDDPSALREELLRWRETYTDHPAAGGLLAELLAKYRQAQPFPQQIALLLPLSSVQQPAAQSIRDGFLAAALRDPNATHTRIKVYDTSALGSEEAYISAQLDGADFIVGPLLRDEVEQIAGRVGFVPTLALNFIQSDKPLPRDFFQFALAPEDEARETARYAIANGQTTALALVPNTDWGLRLLNSFRAEFESLGGHLLQFRGYDPKAEDFSSPITSLLNIDRSNQRYRRLAANLRRPIKFEPRRRRDVDMLFVAADAATGRLLAPQLRFHYAGGIPTYATSAIYDPSDLSGDGDLNGVYFTDAPWVLRPDAEATALKKSFESYWPQRTARWIRLYGMGFDAYRLIPLLYDPQGAFPGFAGMSGQLTLDGQGKIHRTMPIAQFRQGQPVVLQPGGSAEPSRVARAQ
jgi:outer membrane PBP1 activator LpoA protein